MPQSPLDLLRANAREVAEEFFILSAIRLELPPSMHRLAIERYIAIRKHIERLGSPLMDRVRIFYPQGSMAIRATIRTPWRDQGYDIDIVAELILPVGTSPSKVLDLLFEAIRGEKGSRYYDCTKRQTRCVTVYYADGMHLDVSPSIMISEQDERLSTIFHAKPEEPPSAHYPVIINSYAFVEHVRARTPIDLTFERRYAREVKRYKFMITDVKADADVVEVPGHSSEEGGKSAIIVALQLLKAYRDERYRKRSGRRLPPSVMLTKFAADVAVPGLSLVQALEVLSAHSLAELTAADRAGKLIDVRNPTCKADRFTDRWPETAPDQRLFIADLGDFRRYLAELTSGRLSMSEVQKLLGDMFGVGPAQSAIKDLAEQHGSVVRSGQRTHATPFGGVRTAAAAIASPKIVSARTPNHTFYGSIWQKPQKR